MTETTKRYLKGKLYNLSLSELAPDPNQPRKYFDEQALSELQASISKHGVLQPILARRAANGALVLVSGERRYQAAQRAGLATVPVVITDGDATEVSIVENLLRENLTAVEEAEAIDRLKGQNNYTLADLAAILGKSESTLSEILSITKLPAAIKDDCRNERKAPRYLLTEIAKQPNPKQMTALYLKFKKSGLTRGEIRSKEATGKEKPTGVDVDFVKVCLKKLEKLEIDKLHGYQASDLTEDLLNLSDATKATLDKLSILPLPIP